MDGADRTLVVLRHSKAAFPPGVADLDRPLAERGEREAPFAGRWLRDHAPVLDLVVRSPASRVLQSWELVHAELGYAPQVRDDERLYAEPVSTILNIISELPDDVGSVLLVGHNPELSGLVTVLCGTEVDLKTSAIAVLSFNGDWRDVESGSMQLADFATPRPDGE